MNTTRLGYQCRSCLRHFLPVMISACLAASVRAQEPADTLTDESGTTIDSVKEYFNVTGTGDSTIYSLRRIPPELIRKTKKDKNFWYADSSFVKKVKTPAYVPLSRRSWFQTLLWIVIIGGFAAGLIWYLAGSQVGLFRKRNVFHPARQDEGDIPEDIFAINYGKEIERAVSQANFRLAVRLHFLRLLKTLSERNIIEFKQDRTNFDYLSQVHAKGFYSSFFRLVRHYEFSWYGHFEVGQEAYSLIREDFDQFDHNLLKAGS